MNALNLTETMLATGLQAKKAAASMAKASTATKNRALTTLAALLRANGAVLQEANAKDIARAEAPAWPRRWWTGSG